MNHVGVHVIYIGVIGEVAAIPPASFIPGATIPKTVIDSAIEAHLIPPISFVEEVGVGSPAPVAGRPEEADLGRLNPRPRHPVVAIAVIVSPVAGRPKIAV